MMHHADGSMMAHETGLYHYDADALGSGGPESAKADFANFPRRIHSLQRADGTRADG
jgi:hypothetical protein